MSTLQVRDGAGNTKYISYEFGNGSIGDPYRGQKTVLYGANDEPVNAFNGAINIHDADTHRSIINARLHRDDGVLSTTISVATTAGDSTITLASVVGLSIGDYLHINDWLYFPQVKNIVGNDVTLDTPVEQVYPIGTTVHTVGIDMSALAGSIAAPISYKITPISTQIYHLTRIILTITDSTAMDDGLFGGASALTNGVIIRRFDGTTSTYAVFTNWKTNEDIRSDMYDVAYYPRSGGGGTYGLGGRGSFNRLGSIVRLDPSAGDYLEILVQDDLTALDNFGIKAQGHFEGV